MDRITPAFLNLQQKDRIVVAMSGGVDSSVAAALLVEAGLDVVGITLKLYTHKKPKQTKACCAGQDIEDAKNVAQKMGFPHYVLDYESLFSQAVIDDFADAYVHGNTPLPCVRCNQRVKFKDLLNTAKRLGAKALATGHYVRRDIKNGRARLLTGKDTRRDQSYFLFATTQAQLDILRFPVGHLDKKTTRAHAARFGLKVADKPDSQDICFVPQGGYANLVAKLRPGSLDPGDIVDTSGLLLGRHKGIIHYTVGQRRGLGVSSKGPLFVVKIDPKTRRLTVGPRRYLQQRHITLHDINWLGGECLSQTPLPIRVKIRSLSPSVQGTVHLSHTKPGKAIITLNHPEEGIAPGQACVFYQKERVLGGGWICHESNASHDIHTHPTPKNKSEAL